MELYPHQRRFLEDNPDRALLVWDTGTGKTLAAVEWVKSRPTIDFLIVCPKQVFKMWTDAVRSTTAVVVTKEQYKKHTHPYGGIVVDEADHGFGSSLFTKGRSAMATTLYNWIRAHDTAPVLLLTATPIRNAPHTSHTLLTYIQKAPMWKEYRALQYNLVSRPYNPRPFYEPKRHWQKTSAKMITDNASVASMSDLVVVPEQHHDIVRLPLAPSSRVYASWHEKARAESGEQKLKWIKEYSRDKRKVVIVARYLDAIAKYAIALDKERQVFVLTGSTKDQEYVIQQAREALECYFLIQADLAAGFELPEFSYMIFASLSFSVRSLTQMKGRVLRINALKSNWYTYLLNGPCDESVYKRVVEEGQDFTI